MKNILEYLENTPYPNNIAFEDTQTKLTFKEIKQYAKSIGSFFAQNKIYKQPVPIFMEKSPQTISGFLGVVYSGNYYVPLDMSMGETRIKMILQKVNSSTIICDNSTYEISKTWGYKHINFNELVKHEICDLKLENIRNKSIDTDPVYVVFTSGSTGTPKGVVATHRGIISYVNALCPVLNINENTVFGNQSPLYLDACLKEIFPTFKYSAKTYLIPPQLFMFPVKLIEFINDKKINTICWVASALSMISGLGALKNNVPKTLQVVAFGSEVFPQNHLKQWITALPNTKFVHLYGPTETTGMATYYVVDKNKLDSQTPIGQAFNNREVFLINESGHIPRPGQTGEIYIRGCQLSPGYFADPKGTNNRFIQNPLLPFPDIVYKTGDLAYENENGHLVFISRIDHQIKHMGYRIELTEIEATALNLNEVAIACAVFYKEKSRIELFYSGQVSTAELSNHLKQNLPKYMEPKKIHKLKNLPLTPGGKVDRQALVEKVGFNNG